MAFSSNILVSSRPSATQLSEMAHDFSDVHPFTGEGFIKYISPLLPSHEELISHDLPINYIPPQFIRRMGVSPIQKRERVGKFNKPPHDKPSHKVACPSAFIDDCWSVEDADL